MTDEQKTMQIDDLYNIVSIEDPQIDPSGKWIAFVKATVNKMDNGYDRNIWIRATDESAGPVQLTRSGKDFYPRWSPDGETLAFVSARNERPQVFLLPVGMMGGEARQLTSMENGAVTPEWSNDGTQVAFLSASTAEEREKEDSDEEQEPPADKLAGKHEKERKADTEKRRLDPFTMTRIPYRQGTSFVDGRHAQVYVIPVDEHAENPEPRRLTNMATSFSSLKWSSDDKYIFTSRTWDIDADEPFLFQTVVKLDVESGTETEVTPDRTHMSYAPDPSPDGKWLALIVSPTGNVGDLEANPRLAVMPIDGGDIREISNGLDRQLSSFEWRADSQHIIVTAANKGQGPIYQIKVDDASLTTLAEGEYRATEISVDDAGNIATVVHTPLNPCELKWLPAGTRDLVTLTDFNEKWLEDVMVQPVHEMWFKSPSGKDIQGWYMLPVGYEAGKTYPLALNIHGGPRVMWSPSEPTMFHEWQVHAASGYVVFFCNPRGGAGYGEAFQRDLHAAWGEVAMEDIMTGVDTLLEKGVVDEHRMAITGGSYGGYMTSWIVGHSDRFASAVTQRGVYNLSSFYGTSDIPILIKSDYGVDPWEDRDLLWKHSPLAYATNINTPLLIIHAEHDYRVPIEQAEQLFAWVRRGTDTPVEMVRYPRDGHELSRSGEPEHRISRLTRMVEWFDRYCKPE